MNSKFYFIFLIIFSGLNCSIPSLIFVNIFPIGANQQLHAQTRYPFKEYEDRKEGITEEIDLIKFQKLSLISATIENNEITTGVSSDSFYLSFYLEQPTRIYIEVKKKVNRIDKFYVMQPSKNDFSDHINRFSWPSEIPLYYNITVNDLLSVAEIYNMEMTTIVPLVLFRNRPVADSLVYIFCLIPQQPIERLVYKINTFKTDQLVYNSQLTELDQEQPFYIIWDGKDNGNTSQKSGWYYLNIEALFEPTLDDTLGTSVPINYKFYHKKELLESELFEPTKGQ